MPHRKYVSAFYTKYNLRILINSFFAWHLSSPSSVPLCSEQNIESRSETMGKLTCNGIDTKVYYQISIAQKPLATGNILRTYGPQINRKDGDERRIALCAHNVHVPFLSIELMRRSRPLRLPFPNWKCIVVVVWSVCVCVSLYNLIYWKSPWKLRRSPSVDLESSRTSTGARRVHTVLWFQNPLMIMCWKPRLISLWDGTPSPNKHNGNDYSQRSTADALNGGGGGGGILSHTMNLHW